MNFSRIILLIVSAVSMLHVQSQECSKILKVKKGIAYLKSSKELYSGACIQIDKKSKFKESIHPYKNGQLDGTEKWFYEDGNVKMEIDFKEGRKDGLWRHYSPDVLLTETVEYQKGKAHGKHSLYFESGKVRLQRNFKEGVLNGHWIEYFEDGQVNNKCAYKNGVKEGEYHSYYPNGNIQSEYEFKNDKIHGVYRFYDIEGNIIYMWMYENGVKGIM